MSSKVEGVRDRGVNLCRLLSLTWLLVAGCSAELQPSANEVGAGQDDAPPILAQLVNRCGPGYPEVAVCGQDLGQLETGKVKVSVGGSTTEVQYKLVGSGNRKVVIQGDIVVGYEGASRARTGVRAAAVVIELGGLWLNGRIPYELDPTLSKPDLVRTAMDQWESVSPVRFVKRTTEVDYVTFLSGLGCSSSVGRIGGHQFVDLHHACGLGSITHELGHVIGLFHEHSRTDRDRYVKIDLSNVDSLYLEDFAMISGTEGADFGPYDFASIMHYQWNAFAKDEKKPTIAVLPGVALPAGFTSATIGKRDRPSNGDIAAVRNLYAR